MGEIQKIAVVGSGAVGSFYGARLANKNDVSFLMRRDLSVVRENGLTVESVDEDFTLDPVQAFSSTSEIGPVDLVLIALKATSNEALPELIAPLLQANTTLLTLQNGLGNEEFLHHQFPDRPIFGGMCFVCINRGNPGIIYHLAGGKVEMGKFTEQGDIEEVVSLFTDAGLDCRLLPDLGLARWRKLIWNVPFNGLSIASGGIDTQQILSNPGLTNRTRALMHELITAAAAQGYEISPEFAEANIENTRKIGAYKPSSLIDFDAGTAVEVEAIWGEPLRRATGCGVDTPELKSLHDEICLAIEKRSS